MEGSWFVMVSAKLLLSLLDDGKMRFLASRLNLVADVEPDPESKFKLRELAEYLSAASELSMEIKAEEE